MRFYLITIAAFLAIFTIIGSNKYSQAAYKGAITKAKDGYTVEELYAKKTELSGKKVSVKGKVVKFNGGIMGRNWVHLQDGTGSPAQMISPLLQTRPQRWEISSAQQALWPQIRISEADTAMRLS